MAQLLRFTEFAIPRWVARSPCWNPGADFSGGLRHTDLRVRCANPVLLQALIARPGTAR